jgi:Coenzyme PQQ synthesis protein D (PqqD)
MLDHVASPRVPVLMLRTTISAAVLDDGAVLLDLESKYFYALNGSAWAITQLFESGAKLADVTERAGAWGAPDDRDILNFVDRLREYGLLEDGAEPSAEGEIAWSGPWTTPTIERQAEPLQTVMVSAFDPSIPLAE